MASAEAIGSRSPRPVAKGELDDIEKSGDMEPTNGPPTPLEAETIQISNWKKPY